MFKIKWHRPTRNSPPTVVAGLSRYPSRDAADRQVARWQLHFPANKYFVERA
jgi:hypothetical protein